jgi:hypothetical protein
MLLHISICNLVEHRRHDETKFKTLEKEKANEMEVAEKAP